MIPDESAGMGRGRPTLSEDERAVYEWQMWVSSFGEQGQRRLKQASVLISRCGGLGGAVAYQLAAAGVGRLILAHGGNVRPSDLNRQLLMTHDWIGRPRVESAARRLRELNPRLEVEAIPENIAEANAARLVGRADLVVDAAPLFEERYLLNRESVRQRKPMVECAVYDLDAHLTTFLPGQTPCLACLCPDKPAWWRREFPVFGAVSGAIGSLAAMEVIKVTAGFGQPLAGRLLVGHLRDMTFRTLNLARDRHCPVCGDAVIP
jgi:molybdopterin/thiamine biosynthesis adenylyltransferase